MSIALRPTTPLSQWGWLPLLAGVGVVHACADVGLSATLKWPNDIVVLGNGEGPRKLGGILVERVDATAEGFGVAAVVGIGLNVDLTVDELPTPLATSFLLEGCQVDREWLATRVLDRVVAVVEQWDQSAGDVHDSGLMDRYRSICSTLGRMVRVERPGGTFLIGTAIDVDDTGGLVIKPDGEAPVVVTAGDVVHLRLHDSPD
jgi:BirA family biotin operon repressor/biotin-[acetyl-CoA-carboxylase] ligase